MKSVSPRIARPRLTRPQHGRASSDGLYSSVQNGRPVARVEGDDFVDALRGRALQRVQHAVDDERRRLEFLERLALPHPLQLEVLHVGRRDLRQRAVALVEQVLRIRQPVLRLFLGVLNAVERHLLR